MWITNLTLRNYRCFKNLELSFDSHLTVLVAANGQGKTSILDALASLLSQFTQKLGASGSQSLRDDDFRDEWSRGADGKLVKRTREPAMSIAARADVTGYSVWKNLIAAIPWDLQRLRDDAEQTVAAAGMTSRFGMADLKRFADAFVTADNEGKPVPYPIFAYYGTERSLPRTSGASLKLPDLDKGRVEAYRSALQGSFDYRFLLGWLLKQEHQEQAEIISRKDFTYESLARKAVQLAISKVMPGFSNLRAVDEPAPHLEIDAEADGQWLRLIVDRQLSDGFKIVLTLTVDLVSRILAANGGLPGMTPEALLSATGVVLIDEVDLHLHPSWQQHVLSDLRSCFPNLQFIVTTHSPQVVSSVNSESLYVLKDGRAIPMRGSRQTEGLDANQLLTDIFETPFAARSKMRDELDHYARMLEDGTGFGEEGEKLYGELVRYFGAEDPVLSLVTFRRDLLNPQSGGEGADHAET